MFTLTIQLLIKSSEVLASGEDIINMTKTAIIIVGTSIGTKVLLYLYCKSVKGSASVDALSQGSSLVP